MLFLRGILVYCSVEMGVLFYFIFLFFVDTFAYHRPVVDPEPTIPDPDPTILFYSELTKLLDTVANIVIYWIGVLHYLINL